MGRKKNRMIKYGRIILALAAVWVVAGVASAEQKFTFQEYIQQYTPLVLESQEVYGIPASIKMAQALLESSSGNSRLAREANNHFGIKCKSTWTGATILHDDDAIDECFRSYGSAEESFKDHSDFLDQSPRYQELFKLDQKDYRGWANGLQAAGYATNPSYAEKLIKIIEDNRLYLLDQGESVPAAKRETAIEEQSNPADRAKVDIDNYVVSQRMRGYALYNNNGTQFVVAKEGDTFEMLGRVVNVSPKNLRKFNDLPADAGLQGGDMIYIKRKAKRAENGKLIHLVREGDTMHSISQQYGIRLQNLADMNRRNANARLLEGQQIRLM